MAGLDQINRDKVIQAGWALHDTNAVERLWDAYADDLFAMLCSMLGQRQDAEDCLQQVFAKLIQRRDCVRRARDLRAYVFQVARNEARTFVKRMNKRSHAELKPDWLVMNDAQAQQDLQDQMAWALNTLPEKQRTVLILKWYRDRTFQEIATMLGLSPNTVASQYRYGLSKLKTLLEDHDHE